MAKIEDARLTEDVLSALRADAFLRPLTLGMRVDADNGVVTLTGSIDSQENRQAAEDAVRRVEGVKQVYNRLTLMGQESSERADSDLQREVIEEIRKDPSIQPERFYVRARMGAIYLSGEAQSEEERDSVIAAARRVPGVEGVEDRIEVHVPVIE